MPKIYAPNRTFRGAIAGVAFVDGVAEATEKDHQPAFAYFRRHGYGIGKRAEEPETAPEWDARDIARTGPHRFGTELRDAAVDPRPEDFLPPTNAGEADPHGPLVVAPEIHASGPKGVKPGDIHVDDTDAQQAAETELATAVLVEGEEHPGEESGSVDLGAEGAEDTRSVKELRDAAKAAGKSGYSRMNRDELLALLGEES